MEREKDGKFKPGVSGNPNGRPRKEREERFYEIAVSAVTFEDWKQIVKKAAEQAKRGDAVARKWLGDNLMGVPVQRIASTDSEGNDIQFVEVTVPKDDSG